MTKPHTSVTALRTCVYTCWFGPTTYPKFQTSAFKYFTKINIMKHVKTGSDPEQIRLKLKHAWQFVDAFKTDLNRQTPWQTNLHMVCTMAEVASGKGHVRITL